jgi:ABC-type glycerol-3-phosphate transport system permease component
MVHSIGKALSASRRIAFFFILVVIAFVALFPLYWVFTSSIKNYVDVFAMPPKLTFTPTWDNYSEVFGGKRILHYVLNSVIVALTSTLVALVLGVPAAYSLAQFKFRGRRNLSFFILSIRIAPPIMSIFPLYMIFNRIGLVGTRASLVIMYTVLNLPLAVWIMQIFFQEVSIELREAAIVDGCSEFQAFLYVMVPVVRTGLSATSILCIIQAWNEYLLALVLTSQKSQTLPVAITTYMTHQGIEWGPISAAAVVVMVPMIMFGLLAQKNLVKGMTLGAIKG